MGFKGVDATRTHSLCLQTVDVGVGVKGVGAITTHSLCLQTLEVGVGAKRVRGIRTRTLCLQTVNVRVLKDWVPSTEHLTSAHTLLVGVSKEEEGE